MIWCCRFILLYKFHALTLIQALTAVECNLNLDANFNLLLLQIHCAC